MNIVCNGFWASLGQLMTKSCHCEY